MILSLHPTTLGTPYLVEQQRWRGAEDAALRREGGWLSLAGLAWLTEGIATIGAAPDCDIVLRGAGVPAHLGTATLLNGTVILQVEPGAGAMANGRPFTSLTMRSDATDHPDRVRVGSLTLTLIQRGKRIGFRVSDSLSAKRKSFRGLRWFPIDPSYRVSARWVPYAKPKTLLITNVLGDVREAPCFGYAEFRLDGKTVRLDAEDEGDSLFFNFRDLTRGRETYAAGRFLDADKPKNGVVVLDFNRATNPPCAFTDYATCPLPPKQNVLPVAIRAGALNGHER